MSEDEEKEKIKKIAKLRAVLENRVETMETELDGLKTLLSLIDATLIKEGFKRAEISKPVQTPPKQATPPPSVIQQKKGVPLKTVTGDLLAQLYTEKDSMQNTVAEDKVYVWKKGEKRKRERVLHGGTDFNAPTKYVNDRNFDGHIIITDMMAPKPIRSKCQRMWLTDKHGERYAYWKPANERLLVLG